MLWQKQQVTELYSSLSTQIKRFSLVSNELFVESIFLLAYLCMLYERIHKYIIYIWPSHSISFKHDHERRSWWNHVYFCNLTHPCFLKKRMDCVIYKTRVKNLFFKVRWPSFVGQVSTKRGEWSGKERVVSIRWWFVWTTDTKTRFSLCWVSSQ